MYLGPERRAEDRVFCPAALCPRERSCNCDRLYSFSEDGFYASFKATASGLSLVQGRVYVS